MVPKTIREWLTENKDKYFPDRRPQWVKDCAAALGVSLESVWNKAAKVWVASTIPVPIVCSGIENGGMKILTEEDLRRKHDNIFKVEEAARRLREGEFVTEHDFVSSLGLRGSYRPTIERSEFEKYRGRAEGNVYYWGHPNSIAKMKREGILQ